MFVYFTMPPMEIELEGEIVHVEKNTFIQVAEKTFFEENNWAQEHFSEEAEEKMNEILRSLGFEDEAEGSYSFKGTVEDVRALLDKQPEFEYSEKFEKIMMD